MREVEAINHVLLFRLSLENHQKNAYIHTPFTWRHHQNEERKIES
jgi:hypothetical protein